METCRTLLNHLHLQNGLWMIKLFFFWDRRVSKLQPIIDNEKSWQPVGGCKVSNMENQFNSMALEISFINGVWFIQKNEKNLNFKP
ncbi:hypothetical protein DsansV1_C13g0118141 [Dioscorea sansibarensis]